MQLQDKTAVITGAGSGVGRASAVRFAEEGARVVVADVARMIAAADAFGRLDIVFNNVGIPTPRLGMTFLDHSLENFERLTAVNFRGVFLGMKHAIERFREQGDGGVILPIDGGYVAR